MLVASLLLVLGLVFSVVAVQVADVRLSGVLVVPLASVYTLYEFVFLPAFLASVGVAYVTIIVLRRRTLLFGRPLLLASISAGAIIPLGAVAAVNGTAGTSVSEIAFLGSILPGVAAYNLSRQSQEKRVHDALISLAALCSLVVVGASVVNPTTATLFGDLTPAVLFGQSSDVAAFRTAAVPTTTYDPIAAGLVATVGLLGGLVIHEGVYARWGIRLTGMVAMPLLALFALRHPVVVVEYVAGIVVVFATISVVARRTLIYGRVLLATGVCCGVLVTIPLALVIPSIPGFLQLFAGVLIGIGAYNVHRVPPVERSATVWLSAVVFVGYTALFWTVASSPAIGPEAHYLVAGVLVVMLAGREIAALEQTVARTQSGVSGRIQA